LAFALESELSLSFATSPSTVSSRQSFGHPERYQGPNEALFLPQDNNVGASFSDS
jgi:hypothetical protein